MDRSDDSQIIRGLYQVAESDTNTELLQFRSVVSGHQYRHAYAGFRDHVAAGSEVLDWGCGNGHFSFFLQRAGYHATGFSFEPGIHEDLLPDADYRFVLGDPAEPVALPFDDESFDAVASIGVLEHVRETGGTEHGSLSEISRVLRPGGRLVCCHFPNRDSWIDRAARRAPGKYVHEYRYTSEDIVLLVQGANLNLLDIWRYGVLPRNLWHRAPRVFRSSESVAATWNALDDALAARFGRYVQNLAFVAQKPAALRLED